MITNIIQEHKKEFLWAASFVRRHRQLSVSTPEVTSAARARAFNAVTVGQFFSLLESTMDVKHFSATRIFNVDETELTTVQGSQVKSLLFVGKSRLASSLLPNAESCAQLCHTRTRYILTVYVT